MPEYVKGVELTQDGMRAIFERMGKNITSGIIYNGNPDIRLDKLDQQGFMPILTGVSPTQESGHWIMLIKGQGNQYYLFDPLGESSGKSYQGILARKLPQHATLSVIPNGSGLNMGLCGYWVASAGIRAHATLAGDNPPGLENLGQTITQDMQNELAGNGYGEITGWLRAVAHEFPVGDLQDDATALRHATAKDLNIVSPILINHTAPKQLSTHSTKISLSPLVSTLLENDDDILTTVTHVHQEYLSKPYLGPLKNPNAPEEGRLKPNEGPDRGTHGLAHTIRTMACAEIMVEEARKTYFRGEKLEPAKDGRTLADVTSEELKKILIAQAFFVVGRDDERSGYDKEHDRDFYDEYHEKSEAAFRKYVIDNKLIGKIFKDQDEVNHYAHIILDNPHNWDGTPAHMLIHQGHMVDLMRVKVPQEAVVENAFATLKDSVGALGAEVVLKTHREFFLATGAVVPLFNPQALNDPSNSEPYQNPYSGAKYVIKDGEEPKSKKDIRLKKAKYQLKDNERYVTMKEYYALPEVQQEFPGSKTYLESSPYMMPTPFASLCERKPTVCLGAIQEARTKVKVKALKEAFQSPTDKTRRSANADEIAAARIIQQILANPNVIQNDHVLLNGQRLEEQFFRDLMAQCDLAIVGALLNDNDMKNIDRLMQHERNTEFHSTDSKAVPVNLGETWEKTIRHYHSSDKNQIKHDLVFLMQNDAWYYSRVNAIAQNRDQGSTFKEVLITALMTPLTSKALVDTHGKASSPKTLFRGLNFSADFQNKLIHQANTIIAHTENHLFTDCSAKAFMQIKLNDFSKISAKTNASNSTNIEVPRTIFDSNTIFEINDPEKLLQAKQVGTHIQGSEDEFSFYLADDVALIPTKVTLDGKTSTGLDRYIISLTVLKSPDFAPRQENGLAVEPLLKMQSSILATIKNSVEQAQEAPNLEKVFLLQALIARQLKAPLDIRYKAFLSKNVAPALEQCLNALLSGDASVVHQAYLAIPPEEYWAYFDSAEMRQIKIQMDVIKKSVEKKFVLEGTVLPALIECEQAVAAKNIVNALQALHRIPSDKEMIATTSISNELRVQIQGAKQALIENLDPLRRAVITANVIHSEQVNKRYETLINHLTKQLETLGTAKLTDLADIKKEVFNFTALQEEIKVLRNEKARTHTGSGKIDFSDIEKLEQQLPTIHQKLYDAYINAVAEEIDFLEQEKPKSLVDVKKMISCFNERLAEVEQLRQEKIKKHGASINPVDTSDIDKLKAQLQPINHFLVKAMSTTLWTSLNQMEVTTFDEQKKEAQQNLAILTELAKTLEDSDTTKKQKEHIQHVSDFFVEKQKAYPAMIQLQFKSEALILRLRELCDTYQAESTNARKTKTQELTNNRWTIFQGITDFVGITTDERVLIAKKGKVLAQFQDDLNNDKYDIKQLIQNLAMKNINELEEGMGISNEIATKLQLLLKQLSQSTTFVTKIDQRSKLIDEILAALSKKSMTLEQSEMDDPRPQQQVIGL